MAEFRRRGMGGVKATRLPADVEIDGVQARSGDWLVVHEDGVKEIMSDGDFRRDYESATKASTATALVRRGSTELAPRGRRLRPIAATRPGWSGGRRDEGGGIVKLGDGLAGIVNNVLSKNVLLPGLRVIDDETGQIVYERPHGIDVDAERRPAVTGLRVNPAGVVIEAEIKPEEWPPRRGAQETF